MAKELFDYSGVKPSEYLYYGFHLVDGRYHIDTRRIKKLGYKGSFPEEIFTAPRNTHYFIPRHKKNSEFAIFCLRECLGRLTRDWNMEYKDVIAKLTTPKEVFEQTRVGELMFTSSADDLDEIEVDALLAAAKRANKYDAVIKSIHLQYLQKVFIEYFRALYLVIKERSSAKKDFSYVDLLTYVNDSFGIKSKRVNPIYGLPHYRYLDALNKIDNFLKHHSENAYGLLANNPFEKDPEVKAFLTSFVFSEKEAGYAYETGMYAGNWLKIRSSFVQETLDNLYKFSEEFCKLMYDEDPEEPFWNSDEALLKILKDNFFDFM